MREYIITQDNAGARLDKFLQRVLGAAPKTLIHKLLRKKTISLNGKRADGSAVLAAGDVVRIFMAEGTLAGFAAPKKNGVKGPLDVVYEDESVVFVNKPAGLLVQPGEAEGDSLVKRLLYHYGARDGFAPAAVNRLDRNTSGLVMCAKTPAAARVLAKLVHDRKIEKLYLGIAQGTICEAAVLRGFHSKNAKANVAKIGSDGDEVITEIAPIGHFDGATVLQIKLITGKSHQIRAHLQSIGHPLLGDKKYGGKGAAAPRQMLHASKIAFAEVPAPLAHLSGQSFMAAIPKDMGQYFGEDDR